MTLFVGRQPILNMQQKTYGYELLFRDGVENAFDTSIDADYASLSVIDNTVGQLGMQQITGGRKAFINFTRRLLLDDFGHLLPKEHVVIEILETIEPDAVVVNACRRLKEAGYTLALDDFQYRPEYDPLLEIIDLIKVDLAVSDENERRRMAEIFLPRGIELLAERVETPADFEQTREMGYSYFQGYFFSRPVILTGDKPPESKLARMQLLHVVNGAEFNLDQAAAIIKHDATLSMKLFRYINSAFFSIKHEVSGIRHALTLLGEKNIKKWATLLILSSMVDDKPAELLRQAIVRARFCELLAGSADLAGQDQELFITGIFSLLDTMLEQSMANLLADMPIAGAVKSALLGKPSPYLDFLSLAIAFETGDWSLIADLAQEYKIPEPRLTAFHGQAFQWADKITLD